MNSELTSEKSESLENSVRRGDEPQPLLKSQMTCEQLLTLALDIGERMIICGAETNRVEDSINRICTAYGCIRVDVFSITSYLSACIMTSDGRRETQGRRIYSYKHNLDKLEYLNAVSRYICSNTPAFDNIKAEVAHLRRDRLFPWPVTILGYLLSSGVFTIFFGGSVRDALAAALISLPAYGLDRKIKPLGINPIMYNFFCTFLLGILARLVALTGFTNDLDKVLIGLVMLYVPGIQMTNSIRDILGGDIMSGMLRLIEAVILAVSIAVGFAASVTALNVFF